jgi:hypothetical protein
MTPRNITNVLYCTLLNDGYPELRLLPPDVSLMADK